MKYARSAISRARFTLCSTTTMATPSSARRRSTGSISATTTGARPSESSSTSRTRGRLSRHIASASICCWPPDRLAAGLSQEPRQDGEHLERARLPIGSLLARRRRRRGAALRRRPRGEVEVLGDREPTEHPGAAGELDDAEVGDLVGRRVGDVAAVEHHGTTVGFDDATDRLEQRALAGAVRAEQGHDLAFAQVEVDAVDDRATAVAGLQAAHQQQVGPSLPALVQRLRAGRGGAPDLGDVTVDDPMGAAQHERADDERRGPSPASRSGSSTRRRSTRRAAGSAGRG